MLIACVEAVSLLVNPFYHIKKKTVCILLYQYNVKLICFIIFVIFLKIKR